VSAGGDRVTYHTSVGTSLQAVVGDLSTGQVLWQTSVFVNRVPGVELTAPGYLPSEGLVVTVEANDDAVTRASNPAKVVAHDAASGDVRWQTPSTLLFGFAYACGDNACVEIDSSGQGAVAVFDGHNGRALPVRRAGYDRVVGGDDVLPLTGDLLTVDADGGSGRMAALTGFRDAVVWDEQVADVFGTNDVSPNFGWAGRQSTDGGWILWLSTHVDKNATVAPTGLVAGIGPHGEPRWVQPWRPCASFQGTHSLVKCDGVPTRQPDNTAIRTVAALELVDPASGSSAAMLTLQQPFDDFKPAGRLLLIDQDRWALKDGDHAVQIDLAHNSITTRATDTAGWCAAAPDHVQLTHDTDGKTRNDLIPAFQRPCNFNGDLDAAAAATQLRDGSLSSSGGVAAGRYTVWVDDKTLVAVARNS
jgi:hypothetical protein